MESKTKISNKVIEQDSIRILQRLKGIARFSLQRYADSNQVDALSLSGRLDESLHPWTTRMLLGGLSFWVMFAIIWASFSKIQETSVSHGFVESYHPVNITKLNEKAIHHVLIREGMRVRQGDVLMTFDDGDIQTNLDDLKKLQVELALKSEMLRAMISDDKPNFSLVTTATVEQQQHFQDLFDTQWQSIFNQKLVLRKHFEQSKVDLAYLDSLYAQKESDLNELKASYEIYLTLMKQSNLSRNTSSELNNKILALEAEIETIKSQQESKVRTMEALDVQLLTFDADRYEQHIEELTEINHLLGINRERIYDLKEQLDTLVIKAPVSGIVTELREDTEMLSLEMGANIMTIVPENQPLMLQARIKEQDMSFVRSGQPVKVNIGAYDSNRFGSVQGEVEFVSAALNEDHEGRFYEGRIRLEKNFVGQDSSNLILPGMAARAEIITNQPSILGYLLQSNTLKEHFTL